MKMGMFGAGLASTIGYFTSVILFLYLYYYKKDTLIHINFHHFKYDFTIFIKIIKLTVPLTFNSLIISLVGLIINIALHLYAPVYTVVAIIIILKIQYSAYTPIGGISKGLCIVIGHLNGAIIKN